MEGKTAFNEKHKGQSAIDTVKEQIHVYLGENLSSDASNKNNVEMKLSKGKGVINEIIFILNNIHLGSFYFQTLKLLREALMISVITNQSEIWINVTEKQLKQLEALDASLLSRALLSSSKRSQCIMLLELGMQPIRYFIMKKRIMYLHHLLTKGVKKLANQVLQAQMKRTLRGDWYFQCQKDLKELNLTIEEIKSSSKTGIKKRLNESINKAALDYLIKTKNKQSKGRDLFYHSLEMQPYFLPQNRLSIRQMQQIFQLRSRNLPLKANFPNQFNDKRCVIPECSDQDSQKDLFHCKYLDPKNILMERSIEYEDLFSNDVKKQVLVMNILYKKYNSRLEYMASRAETPRDQEDE